MATRIKKRFDINVTVAGDLVTQTFELDKNVTAIFGVLLTSDHEDLMYYRGAHRLEINRQEIFPSGYEAKLLMSGINVAPDERYYSLGKMVPGNYKVKVDYQDVPDGRTVFAAYRISLYIDCELTDLS